MTRSAPSCRKRPTDLPKLLVCSQAAANAVMMGSGYFNPLTGFMSLADALSVCENMKTTDGLFFPTPIVNVVPDVSAIGDAKRIALLDPNVDGNPVIAIQDVTSIDEATDEQMATMTKQAYGTDDPAHPGVAAFNSARQVLHRRPDPGPELLLLRQGLPRHLQDRHGDPRHDREERLERRSPPSRPATPCTGPTRSSCASAWTARAATAP